MSDRSGPFGEQIAARMRELGMERLEAFAEHAKLGATTVYNLVYGRISPTGEPVKPSIDTLARLAIALDAPLHELVYQLVPEAIPRRAADTTAHHATRIEILPAGVDQGKGWGATSLPVDLSLARGRDLVACRSHGTAMAAGPRPIHDGDLLIVDRAKEGDEFDAVVIRLADRTLACRTRVHRGSDIVLVARNLEGRDQAPLVLQLTPGVEVLGRVVRVVHEEIA